MHEEQAEQSTVPSHTYQPGDTLMGRFRITGKLGRGGFATVYRAVQLNLNQEVAIKILDRHDDKPEAFVERFLREARTVAQIRHPDIVRVLDFGVTDDGDPFMVMELLEGYSLEDELRKHGALSPERALRLMIRGLDALQAAHVQGIVHRDLKPANLFLTNIGSVSETLRILDFGIARVLDADNEKLTVTGQILGTPAFLPPEYITHHQISPALDVYQMGLILVQMITGRSAVGGRSLYQSMLAHVSGELDIPTELLASVLGPPLAGSIALHVTDRFKDAGSFRDALSKVDATALPSAELFIRPNEPTSDMPVFDSAEVISAPGHEDRRQASKATSRIIQSLARGEVPPELSGAVDIVTPLSPVQASWPALPTITAVPHLPTQPTQSGPPTGIIIAIVAVLLVAGGLGAALFAMHLGEEPDDTAQLNGLPVASAPAEEPTPTTTQVEVVATPDNAEIFSGATSLGRGRAFVTFKGDDDAPVALRVQAEGFEPATLEVRPDQRDAPVQIDLAAAPPASAPVDPPASEPLIEDGDGDDEGGVATRRRGDKVARRDGRQPAGSAPPASAGQPPATAPRKSIGLIDDDSNTKPPKTIGILQ